MYQVIGILGVVCTFIGLIWSILIATTPYSKYPKGIDQKIRHVCIAVVLMLLGIFVCLGASLMN